ncbi:hypothetical protein D4450_11185 [Salmonella enterica subsp. enterica]|nr:hypothetical protein [Salmonella enterica subsp. enterica]
MPDSAALIRPTVLQLPHTQKSPSEQDGLLHLSDAWQFMAGVLPATLRAVAAQRANPLPADLSCSGERSPTDYR